MQVDYPTIFGKLDPIYKFLSQNAHAQGLDVHDLQDGRDNVPRYLSRSFEIWYAKLLEAYDVMCFLYRIFYVKELSSYLARSAGEATNARRLSSALSPVLPNLEQLISKALSN